LKKISLIIITISGLLLSFMPMAISDVNIPPKGVSQSLWDVYRELTISELDGAERNFRSANALSVFIKGSPTERDVNVIDSILSAFAQNCQNITPKRATVLPRAGVVFHFITPSEFKTIIPGTTQKISAIQWWYYPGTGINDAIALISTDITDLQERDFYIRYRLLNSLGFYHALTDSADFNLFGFSYTWESQNTLTEMDRQLISFYCSTLVRAWDTEVQTQDYINSLWNKSINTDSGIEILVEPKGDQTVINHGTKIGYQLVDTNGLVVASDEIDIQDDVFKTRIFQVKDLKSFSTYTLKLYSKNIMGKSSTQNIAVSTRVVISEAAKAAADKVIADAAAKAAADKVIADAAAAKAAADKVIADAAAAKAAADKVIADAAAAKAAAAKVLADAAAKAAADKVLADAAVKAAADKVIADAKMQAEKILADAKAAAELKAKQEADAKAAADKVIADAKIQAEKILADAKAAAELKAKQEADAQAKAAQILADAKAKSDAAAKIASDKKMTTITCVKGKLTKKVTAVKPVCPAGYKKK